MEAKSGRRILHLPDCVGGAPGEISRTMRAQGEQSECWQLTPSPFGFFADHTIFDENDCYLRRMLKRIRAGLYVFQDFDLVQFNFGSTLFSASPPRIDQSRRRRIAWYFHQGFLFLLQSIELTVLSVRGIPYFVLFQGDDVRQGWWLRRYNISVLDVADYRLYSPASDRYKRRHAARLNKRAAGIYSFNPDLMWVLPRDSKFLPYPVAPVRTSEVKFAGQDSEKLVFVHAPTSRLSKGTPIFLKALEELRSEGYEFELKLIEGLDHQNALVEYAKGDILLDQLWFGWYGGIGAEAMMRGKIVVAFVREDDLCFLPPEFRADLPVWRTTPAATKDRLRELLNLPRDVVREMGKRSHEFALKWHSSDAVSRHLRAEYTLLAKEGRKEVEHPSEY